MAVQVRDRGIDSRPARLRARAAPSAARWVALVAGAGAVGWTAPSLAQPESFEWSPPPIDGPFEARAPARPQRAEVPPPTGPTTRTLRRSPAAAGIGPRLAARLRRAPATAEIDFLAVGVDRAALDAAGATLTGRSGAVVAGRARPAALAALARAAVWMDAPQPLRPALNRSRGEVGADETDEGREFAKPHRGQGVLIAAYDTGVDLLHPDLRALDGPSRVLAVWDQDAEGPPAPLGFGVECRDLQILEDACPQTDDVGHGTTVLAAAASSGPEFRGVAPEADLLMVKSSTFGALLPAMTYSATVAAELERPMVFNVSLTGQEGPHDGTSLEAMAIDGFGHLVVVAAGNEGELAVHASTELDAETYANVPLRFWPLAERQDRRATVGIWGAPGEVDLEVSVALITPGGVIEAETAGISPGGDGRTDLLLVQSATVATVDLDASAGLSPLNDRASVRVALTLPSWEDAPAGLGFMLVRVRGQGEVDLWVDTPATEPAPVQFDAMGLLDEQVLGDSENTISDISTAVSAVSVAAYTTRTEVVSPSGERRLIAGRVGSIAGFTSRGPSLSPSTTGAKPDLAAPGNVIVAARSRTAPFDPLAPSQLYRVTAGTSFAAPQVAGAAAVLLGVDPDLEPAELKRLLLESAAPPNDGDPRWGAGRLAVDEAVGALTGFESGCSCRHTSTSPTPRPSGLAWTAVLLLVVMKKRRVLTLTSARLGRRQA